MLQYTAYLKKMMLFFVLLFAFVQNANGAVSFNGSSQYAYMNESLVSGMTTLSMEAWINPSDTSGINHIVGKWTPMGGAGGNGYAMYVIDGKLNIFLANSASAQQQITCNTTISANTWTHVAMAYNGSQVYTFVNGTQCTNGSADFSALYDSSSYPLTIGATKTDNVGYYFNGKIQEVRVWNVSRSPVSPDNTMNSPLVGNESGLVGYYKMNETSGTSLDDLTTNNNNGTLVGTPTFSTENYVISYNANSSTSGSVPPNQLKTKGVSLTLATNSGSLVKTGYTFGGWNTNSGGTGTAYSAGGSYTTDAVATMYAKWNINTYTVTFNTNGGSTVASQTINYNATATQPTTPTKSGYEFLGWYSDSGLTNAFNFSTAITANTTLYAKWQINPTITFTTNGGNTITAVQIESGTKVTKPSDPTKAGYTFVGWYKDSGLTIEFDFDNVITANTTLYAKWTPNIYTISYDANGAGVGSVPSSTSKTHDINVTLATNSGALQKAEYKFVGWNTLADGTGTDYNVSATYSTNSDTTLYAKFVAVGANDNMPEFVFEGGDISLALNKIVAGDRTASDNFGFSVAISGDIAIVGAYQQATDASGANSKNYAGAAYIYTKQNDGSWMQSQKLVASDRTDDDKFGSSVAISGDVAIVGAYGQDYDASGLNSRNSSGAAYIFTKQSNGLWTQSQKLVASDRAANDNFGYSVAIDGDVAIVGAYGQDYDAAGLNNKGSAGAAYIFTKVSGSWTQSKKLVASDRASYDAFGYRVAISGDVVIVGAYGQDYDASGADSKSDAGAAYIFTKVSGSWTQSQKLVASDRAINDVYGVSVAISGDIAIVGAIRQDTDGSSSDSKGDAGAAYIYTKQNDGSWMQSQKLVASDRTNYDYFGVSVAISGDMAIVGAYGQDYDASGTNLKNGAGAAYTFTKQSDGSWTQSQKFVASDRTPYASFGWSVAISGDVPIIAAYAQNTDASGANYKNGAGAVYILGPSLPSYTFSVDENSKVAFQAVAIDEGDIITYSISGTDANLLDINSTTGVITFKSKPDYENPIDSGANNVYEFVVSASDGTYTTSTDATVTIKDVAIENYAPIISKINNYEKPEDFSDFNISFNVTDLEEDTITLFVQTNGINLLSLTPNFTSPLTFSEYDGKTLNFTVSSKPNTFGAAAVGVKARDSKGLSSSSEFVINVPAILDFPSITNETIELSEDFGTFNLKLTGIDLAGATSANVATTLADGTNLTVSTPNVTITGNEANITLASVLNGSGTTTATITVTANGQTISKDINITVNPLNDAPSLSNTPSDGAENRPYSWTPTVVDVDSATFSFQANGLPSWATLDTATGTISGTPNYEESGITTILYSVNDGNLSTNYELNITVANTNRTPTDISLSTTIINENTTNIAELPIMSTTDADSEDSHSYSLCSSGYPDNSAFEIASTTLMPINPLNYEAKNSYSVCIRTTDDKNATFDKTFTITVGDMIEDFTISFDPNGASSGAVDSQIRVEDVNITLTDEGNLSRVSYNFIGWNTQPDGSGTSYSSSDIYNLDTDITLYAQWEFFNTPPVFTTEPITTVTENSPYSYNPDVSDVNDDVMTINAINLPSWLSAAKGTNAVIFAGAKGLSGLVDGNATNARFNKPYGLAKDSNGNIYVGEYGNNKIRKITPEGVVTTLAPTHSFSRPQSLVVDKDGNVYVADRFNKKIKKIATDGTVTTEIDTQYDANGVALDSSGNLYALTSVGTIIKKSIDGTLNSKFSSSVSGGQYMAIDKDNNIYVTLSSNHKVVKVSGVDGTILATYGSGTSGQTDGDASTATFNMPSALDIDSKGNLYVVESLGTAKIRKIDTNGNVTSLEVPWENKFYYPRGITVAKDNLIYVANSNSHTIDKVSFGPLALTGKPTVSGVYDVNISVDDGNLTTPQNFQITVSDVNDAPVMSVKSFVVSENNATGSFVGTINATDEDGVSPSVELIGHPEVITYSIVGGDTNSDFAIDGATGEITIAKPLNAYTKSKYSLEVKAQDDGGASTTAYVTVTIADEADAPVAVVDSAMISEDGVSYRDVFSNDTDKDNNINNGSVTIKTQPKNGKVSGSSTGQVTYTPNKDFNGIDSYSYVIYDKTGLESNEANVTVTINPVNDAPVAKGATLYTQEDTNLSIMMGNYASDVDMNELTTTIVTNPSHGSLMLQDGIYTFVPTTNFYGFDKFTYRVNDGISTSTTETIYINVAEINDIPVAGFDDVNTSEDTSVNINVLANDIDDNGLNTNSVAILNQPANGTVAVQGDGTITYTPNLNFNGSDSFSYTVEDDGVATGTQGIGVLISNEAIVNITINPVNDAPVLVASDLNMSEDDTMRINLIANASDVDNILDGNISITTNPANGTIDILENGVIVYNPTLNWNGTDSFSYKVSDGELWSNEVTMTLNVANVNDAPSLVKPANLSKDEDFANFTLTINAQDIDSSNLIYTATSSDTTIANVSMNGNVLTLSSVANTYGSVMVDINVSDGNLTITRNFELNVIGVDDAPIFTQISSKTFSEDGRFDMNLIASDLEGQTITYHASSSDNTKATVSIVNGKLIVTPLADAFGTITVEVNATANGLTTSQTFEVVIEALNDAPIMQTINNLMVYRDSEVKNISIIATDIDSANLTYSAVAANPDLVTLGWSGNILKVTPKETQVGTTDISVTVSDGDKNVTKSFRYQVIQIITNETIKDSGVVSDTNESVMVRFEADDITITAPKSADENGTIEHKITIGEIEIISTSELNGSVVAVTDSGVKTTYENNTTNIKVEIEGLVTGEATHSLDANGTKTTATSEIQGAKTTVKTDENNKIIIETKVTDSSNTVFDVVAKEDGTASHKVTLSNGNESTATSKIKGATTTIKQTGGVETQVINKPTACTGEYVKAIVMTQADGKAQTKFVRYNCTDNSEIGEMFTNTQATPYAPNNNVTIESNNGSTQIITVTPLEDDIRF